MSEQEIINKLVIPLGQGGKKKSFPSMDIYNEFIERERSFWGWLQTSSPYPVNLLFTLAWNKCIEEQLYEVDYDNLEYHIELLNGRCSNWLPVYSFTPEGKYIFTIKEEYGDIIAAFALIHICDLSHNVISDAAQQDSAYVNLLSRYSSQNAYAINLVFSFKGEYKREKVSSYITSVEAAHEQFVITLSSIEEKIILSERKYSDEMDGIIAKHHSLHEDTKLKFKTLASRSLRAINKVGSVARERLTQSYADVKQASAAYHEQVDLDASVSYWKSKKDRNNRNAFIWLIFGVGGSVAATFYLLAEYYAKGGIIGISSNLASTGETVNKIQSVVGSASGGMEHLVFNTTGAALVVTLMAVIIRVALRQFNTYSHLSLEAEERVTMVKTYLALLNEGKLKSDQDRHLALEALFRTSQTGMIAETSFNSPVDIIVKSLADKAKV
ncbi:DUF6161 domain-containing protein [Aeromonas popoffii]|uniref:DUF6161 domain-containing protein n=1 Tax=Aeromonas popoffii TaxID=70856 RepID=UPI000AF0E937|nr:DUF6161 domain-containing protein [Aeromonas popoffii]